MKVSVMLFARARDLAGAPLLELDLPTPVQVGQLRQQLGIAAPQLQPLLPHLLIAVNERYAGDDQWIEAESVVACFPPASGG